MITTKPRATLAIIVSFLVSACQAPQNIVPERSVSSLKTKASYFQEVTDEAGLPNTAASTIVNADFDNDGLVDFIAGNKLYRNISSKERFNFEEITERVGLKLLTGRPMFVDLNNDGLIDVVSTSGQFFVQYKKNSFLESSDKLKLKLPPSVHTLSFVDFNRDGWVDIAAGMDEIHKDNTFTFVQPHIYLSVKGQSFREISSQLNLSRYPAYTRGIHWADYDNNGKVEAYFSNYRLRQNFLFKNQFGNFSDVAPEVKVQGEYNPKKFYDPFLKTHKGPSYGHTIGSVWADFNNDGNLDLWVSNLVHKYVGETKGGYDYRGYVCDDSKIYRNTGAPDYQFVDMRSSSGIALMPLGNWSVYKGDELWSHSTAADFDNDGLLDMYVAQVYNLKYAYSLLFKNQGQFKFSEISSTEDTRVLDSYAGSWADYNNDGKMDLLISGREGVDRDARLRLFKNIYASTNQFIKIKLNGTRSGKNPVTTQVRVFHSKGQFLRQYEGVTGTMNQQNDPVLHFGLGTIKAITAIEVRWSSGQRQIINKVALNSTIQINEPK